MKGFIKNTAFTSPEHEVLGVSVFHEYEFMVYCSREW